ncbi:MAG: hypothetical protein ACAH27_05585 [Xanthobacteraceae bacterium]
MSVAVPVPQKKQFDALLAKFEEVGLMEKVFYLEHGAAEIVREDGTIEYKECSLSIRRAGDDAPIISHEIKVTL